MEQRQIIIDSFLVNYYTVFKKNTDSVLLFLHGWNCNSSIWWPILPELTKLNGSLYFLDLPGFGKSEMPNKPFNLFNYSQIIKEFIEKLKLKKVILTGHSLGGAVALKFSTDNSELLESLILVSPSGIRPKTIKKTIYKTVAKIVKPVFKIPGLQPLRQKIYRTIGSEDYLLTPEMKKTYQAIIKEDLTPILGKVKTKTLIIWGEKDKGTPLSYAKIMKQFIPNSTLKVISNAGHFCFLEQPNQFTEILNTFLKNE